MNEQEIREAVKQAADKIDSNELALKSGGCLKIVEGMLKNELSYLIPLLTLAKQYLEVKGLPEERRRLSKEEYDLAHNMKQAIDDSNCGFNQALHLAKLTQLKKCQECKDKNV